MACTCIVCANLLNRLAVLRPRGRASQPEQWTLSVGATHRNHGTDDREARTLLRCKISKMNGQIKVIIMTAATRRVPANACKSDKLPTAMITKHTTVRM
jgi:hypothetical protein